MHDVGFLSQVDPQLTQYLPSGILKQFPGDKLALLPNEVLLQKVDLGTIAALPNERLLGTGQYAGSGFSLSVIAAMPNERLLGLGKYAGSGFSPAFLASLPNERLLGIGQYAGSGFSPEVLAGLPMDASRRKEIDDYLAANPPAGAAPVTTQSISPPAANLSVQTAAAAAPVTAPAPAPAAAPVLAAAGATALAASPTVQALMGKAPTPAPAQAAAPAPPVVATKTTTPPVVAEKTAVETAAAVTSLPQPPASPQAALLASPAVQSLVPKGTSLPVPPPLVSTAAETQRGEGS
jgi:hypothetical protein